MGIRYEWVVKYTQAGNTFTLDNIQTASFGFGRTSQLEPISSRGGSITVVQSSELLQVPNPGDTIDIGINYGGSIRPVIGGVVRDVTFDYGMIVNADTMTVIFDDILGALGREQVVNQTIVDNRTSGQWIALTGFTASGESNSGCSTQVFTGSKLDYANKLLLTENGRIEISKPTTTWVPKFLLRDFSYTRTNGAFTDSTLGATQLRYDNIQFASLSNSTFTKVVVNPAGLASQVAGSGTRSWTVDTLDRTTTQALNNAEYILGKWLNADPQPIEISCTDVMQPNAYLHEVLTAPNVANLTSVTFRGKTYPVFQEGWQVSVSPEQTRVTLFLSGADQNPYLILDHAVFGVLDQNKLGF